jgi:hypothetical protein
MHLHQTFSVCFTSPDSDEDYILFSFCALGIIRFLGGERGKQNFQRRINCLIENYLQDDIEYVYLDLKVMEKDWIFDL